MGSLGHLQASRRPLARKVQILANNLTRLEVNEKGGLLACVEARSSFLDKIKGKQFNDEKLIRSEIMCCEERLRKHKSMRKMYHDLKQHFWWSRMKRDTVDSIAKCPNCQQAKYDHQRPGRTLQRMPIPEWKWKRIATDFVVGLPKTLGKFDSIWPPSRKWTVQLVDSSIEL
ncbi:uncharacterized protein [Solanum lycopersicum]|uniref:uncharacterized protein n=1 Tax=Solanum lycopersicum TaxID=4081 RepID=UPI00374959BC